MKNKTFGLIFLMCFSFQLWSCNSCGGNAINSLSNINAFRFNFLSLDWNKSTYRSAEMLSTENTDLLNRFNLTLQYHLLDRFRVTVSSSYNINIRKYDDINLSNKAMGDIRAAAYYSFLPQEKKIHVSVGVGYIIPTGQYDPIIQSQNIPLQFNGGRGASGYFINTIFNYDLKSFSINTTATTEQYSRTDLGYLPGMQTTVSTIIYKIRIISDDQSFTYGFGLQYDYLQQDKNWIDLDQHSTGGTSLDGIANFNYNIESMAFSLRIQIPITQKYAEGETIKQITYSVGANYIF